MDMGVSGDTEDRELEATLVEDGNDISQYCIIQSFVIGKSVYLYVTRSGKRYISAQKFEIELLDSLKARSTYNTMTQTALS